MALKDHYLTEDYDLMADELENMHTAYMQILKGVTTANFINSDQHLQRISSSLKTLMSLNARKMQQENCKGVGGHEENT